jgi:hypothetical protein
VARGTTLGKLVERLRAETRHAATAGAGLNVDGPMRNKLRRVQDDLWLERTWGHLDTFRNVDLEAGQQYVAWPTAMDPERSKVTHVRWNDEWVPVCAGITEADYNAFDPMNNERQDPVRKWRLSEGDLIEVWPLPASGTMKLRVAGTRRLNPLLADADTCDLDDDLIVLTAAAEMLKAAGSKDADVMQAKANARLKRLHGGLSKRQDFNMVGDADGLKDDRQDRVRVSYVRAG